jgi:hypothetical protein
MHPVNIYLYTHYGFAKLSSDDQQITSCQKSIATFAAVTCALSIGAATVLRMLARSTTSTAELNSMNRSAAQPLSQQELCCMNQY